MEADGPRHVALRVRLASLFPNQDDAQADLGNPSAKSEWHPRAQGAEVEPMILKIMFAIPPDFLFTRVYLQIQSPSEGGMGTLGSCHVALGVRLASLFPNQDDAQGDLGSPSAKSEWHPRA